MTLLTHTKQVLCVKEKFEESLAKERCLQAQLNASNKSRDNRKEMLDVIFKKNEHLKSENKKLQIENELLQAQIYTANKIIDTYKTASVIADEIIDELKKSNACLLGLLVDRLK